MGNDNSSPAAKRLREAVRAHKDALFTYRTEVEKYDKSLAAFEASRVKQSSSCGGSQSSSNQSPRPCPPPVPKALADHAESGGWEPHIAAMAEGTIVGGDMPVLLDIIRAGLWEELLVPLVRRCKMPEKDIKIESFGADLFSALFSAVVDVPKSVGDTLFNSYDRAEALSETVPNHVPTIGDAGAGKEEEEEKSSLSPTKLFAWWKCRYGNSAGTLLGHYLEDQWDHSRTADPIATLQRLLTPFTTDAVDTTTNNAAVAEGAAVMTAAATTNPSPSSPTTRTCGLGFDLLNPLSIGGYKSASAIYSLFGGSTPNGDRDRHFYFGQQLYGYVLASFLAVYPQSGGTDIRGAEAFLKAQGSSHAMPLWYLLTNSDTSERERVALPLISLLLEATITASIQLAHFYQTKTAQPPGPHQPLYHCCDEQANALLAAVNAATAERDTSVGEKSDDEAYDHLYFGWRAMMGLAPQCVKTSDPKQIPALLLQSVGGSTTPAGASAATLSPDLFRLRLVHRRHILGLRVEMGLYDAEADGMNSFLAYLNKSSQTLPGLQLLLLDPTFVPPSLDQTDTTTPYLPPVKNNQSKGVSSPADYFYYAITLQPRLAIPDATQQQGGTNTDNTDAWLERARSGIVRVGPCGTLPEHAGVRAQWGWCRVTSPITTAPTPETKTTDTARVADTEDEQHRLLVEDLLASVDKQDRGPLDIVAQGDESGQTLRALHYTLMTLHNASMKELREQQQHGAAGAVDVRRSLLYRHIFGMPSDRRRDQAAICSNTTACRNITASPFMQALVFGNAVSVDMMLTAVYVYARDVGQWLLATTTNNTTTTEDTAGGAACRAKEAALREALQCLDTLLLRMHYDEEAWALGRVALRCVAAKRWGLGVEKRHTSVATTSEGTTTTPPQPPAEEDAAHLAASLREALTGLSGDLTTTPECSSKKKIAPKNPWIIALIPNPLQEIKVAVTFARPPQLCQGSAMDSFTITTRTFFGQTAEHTETTAPCPSMSSGDGTAFGGASSALTIEMPLCSLATDFYGVNYSGRRYSLLGPFSQPRRGNKDHSLKEYVSLWPNYEKKSWRLPFGPSTNNCKERDPLPILPTSGDFSGKTCTDDPNRSTSMADWSASAGAVAAERYAERVVGCPSSASVAMCVAKLLQVSLLVNHLSGKGSAQDAICVAGQSGAANARGDQRECAMSNRVPTFRSLQKLLQSTSNSYSIAVSLEATNTADRLQKLLDVFNYGVQSSASAARKAFAQSPLGRLELALDNITTKLFQMPILTSTAVGRAKEEEEDGNEGDASEDAASVRRGPASWRRVIAAAMDAHLPGDAATDACDVRVMRWYKERVAVVMDKEMWTKGFDDVLSAVVRTLDDALLMLILAVSTNPTAAARLLGADPDCRYVIPKLEYVMVQAQLLQRYLRGGPLRYFHSERSEDRRIQGARDSVCVLHRAQAAKGQAADPQHTTAATEGASPPPPSAQIIFDSTIDKKYIYYYHKAYFEDDDQCFGFDNPFADVPASVPAVIPAAFRETLVDYPLRKRFATDIYRLIAAMPNASDVHSGDTNRKKGGGDIDPAPPAQLSTTVGSGSFLAGHGAALRRVFAALRPVLAAEVSATAAAAAKNQVPAAAEVSATAAAAAKNQVPAAVEVSATAAAAAKKPVPAAVEVSATAAAAPKKHVPAAPFTWGALAKGIAVGLFQTAAFFLVAWLWGPKAITTFTPQRKAGVSGSPQPPTSTATPVVVAAAGGSPPPPTATATPTPSASGSPQPPTTTATTALSASGSPQQPTATATPVVVAAAGGSPPPPTATATPTPSASGSPQPPTTTATTAPSASGSPQQPTATATPVVVAAGGSPPPPTATATTAPTVVVSSTQQWVNAVFRRFPPLTTQPFQAENTDDTGNAPPPPPQELDILINGREDRLWDAVQRLLAVSAAGTLQEEEEEEGSTATSPRTSPVAITYEALLTFFETEWHSRTAFAFEMSDL